MFLSRPAAVLAAVALTPIASFAISSPAAADSYVAGGEVLGDFAADTHKAIQQALRTKGYYSGPVDGNFGPMSKRAVVKFRADNHISRAGRKALKLDEPLVNALFGVSGFSVETWDDQFCLLVKIDPVSNQDETQMCQSDRQTLSVEDEG